MVWRRVTMGPFGSFLLLVACASADAAQAARAAESGAPLLAGSPSRRNAPRHFEDISGDLPNEPITTVAVAPDDAQVLYAGVDGFLFKTDDSGDTWRPILSFPRGVAIDDTELDTADVAPDGADTPLDDVPGRNFGSLPDGAADDDEDEDGAEERRAGGLEFGQFDAANDPMPEGDLTDQLADVVALVRAGAGVRKVAFVPGSGKSFVVATPRGLYRTTNGGGAFERVEVPGGVRENDIRDVAFDGARRGRLYAATAAGLFISTDGGTTFRVALGRPGRVAGTSLAAARVGDKDVVVLGTERGLLRSEDGGTNFLDVLLRSLPPFAPVAVVAVAPDDGTVYAGTARGLFVGERGASLLERYEGVSDGVVQALSPDPFRRRGIVMGTRSRGVAFSWDAGLTVDVGAEQVPAGEVFGLARGRAPDDVVVATERGVFRSQPGTGVVVTSSGLKKLQRRWAQEPPLDAVAREAVAWSRLGGDVLGDIRERAGYAAWLPSVLLRYVYVNGRTSRRDEFLLRAGDELPPFLDPANDTRDLFGNIGAFVIQPSQGAQHAVWLQLQWDLDRTILSDSEVIALRQGPRWWAAERALLDRVQTLWSARRRLISEAELAGEVRGTQGAAALLERQLRIDELTAQLDAVTGGAFSRAVLADARAPQQPETSRRSRRAPSPAETEDVQED